MEQIQKLMKSQFSFNGIQPIKWTSYKLKKKQKQKQCRLQNLLATNMITCLLRWPWFVWHRLGTRWTTAWGKLFFPDEVPIFKFTFILIFSHSVSYQFILIYFLLLLRMATFFLDDPYCFFILISVCAEICVSVDLFFLQK